MPTNSCAGLPPKPFFSQLPPAIDHHHHHYSSWPGAPPGAPPPPPLPLLIINLAKRGSQDRVAARSWHHRLLESNGGYGHFCFPPPDFDRCRLDDCYRPDHCHRGPQQAAYSPALVGDHHCWRYPSSNVLVHHRYTPQSHQRQCQRG
ncbi:hypothetical protein NLG97_g8697 [Lecanicillium saksenae]|uniref:Uncharacterized protein n=1 Tax=Lecanicillium saksenae TaxID=468837 RepID=A0ACC1QLH1_9HYPO|nr:hypothetical protein NLG97_g8697 [Lecanicillium saksenae]